MRTYFKLLRLPYQLQLGAIFAWGFWLGGGAFGSTGEIVRFLAVFALFHSGAFGGMTALNSWYDRDDGPVGGMWSPPQVPPFLWHFAWLLQLLGLLFLLPSGWRLSLVYTFLLMLSLLYSHPKSRGKGHPWKSLAIVVAGQGVLDGLAGALTARLPQWRAPFWCGLLGAALTVAAWYPLTQLYQADDDLRRGDQTLAAIGRARRAAIGFRVGGSWRHFGHDLQRAGVVAPRFAARRRVSAAGERATFVLHRAMAAPQTRYENRFSVRPLSGALDDIRVWRLCAAALRSWRKVIFKVEPTKLNQPRA